MMDDPDRDRRRRRALITGASRGLGAALATGAPAGVDLILAARDATSLDEVAARAREGDREVETVSVDLSDQDARTELAASLDGRVDILVNNAGVGAYGPFLERDAAAHAAAVAVNVAAPTHLTRVMLPGMLSRARAYGRRAGLMNISSSFAFAPTPTFAVYAASKAYLLSLTEALAAELRHEPADVLAVCPGPVKTGFGERAGFAGSVPGAMSPEAVAARAWAALGRRRTVVIGALDTPLLTPAAIARTAAAEAAAHGARLLALFQRR